ncbi:MAG: ABC transporter ATP-binding protein [Betaproteobacteria bacterium]|nr:ABC transporter ATP-binding protein [Betaproteobacteria bacterium]
MATDSSGSSCLELRKLRVKYGSVEVLHGIDITVNKGEIVTILGANGAGKTTMLLTISGLLRPSEGEIFFEGKALHTLPSHAVVACGITQAPEGRRIFGTMSVLENLRLGAFTSRDKKRNNDTLEWIFTLFPRLHEREGQLAGTLSGGEQQMLAIGRALMSSPRVLLLDEPSLGLAPMLVRSIFDTIKTINQTGVTVVLVEQNAKAALKLADRGYVLEVGNVVIADTAANLLANPEVQSAYLGKAKEQ